MSLDYAGSLSPYENKGKCGLPERFDTEQELNEKCRLLATMIKESKRVVAITGAGISTSCGIPDFRGPKGVWTLEKEGKKPDVSIKFEEARPSYSHYALVELNRINKLDFLISQNIDGLHMRSGFPMSRLAELHGNFFTEKCNACSSKHIRSTCVSTVGLKPVGRKCLKPKAKGNCRGELHDTILDWEDALPADEMHKSELNCKSADLCLCLGSTLQILPVGGYPLLTKKNGGKIVVINLQETRVNKHADLIINHKLDEVFKNLIENYFQELIPAESIGLDRKIQIKLMCEKDVDPSEKNLILDSSSYVINE